MLCAGGGFAGAEMNTKSDMDRALTATLDDAWVITEDGCDALRESSRETRFAISNGFLGVRSSQAVNRAAHRLTSPYTYVAGLFDTPETGLSVPSLVRAPDWQQVRLFLGSRPLANAPCDPSSHPLTLDLRRGAVITQSRQLDAKAVSIGLRMMRFVSLSRRALGLQLIQLEIEAGEVDVRLDALFEGVDLGLIAERQEQDLGVWRTKHSGKGLAMSAAASLTVDGKELAPIAQDRLRWSWSWKAYPGQVVCFERLVAVTRSDTATFDPGAGAREALGSARRLGWSGLVAEHEAAWASRWRCSDVQVDGDEAAQQSLRFAAYHLNSAANPTDERVSIGARALTGEDYRGHVFWDTEIFLLPFYVLTWPEAARALLMYRFHTLGEARAKAARMGWRGALYAWESADTGAEATPEQVVGPDRQVVDVLCGKQEQHISADVAYAVWQYWQASGDEPFLLSAGAEMLLETGRFWASRAQLDDDGRCHIRGVIGPDEYHPTIDDNAFTNAMGAWNIRRALEVAMLLRDRWPARWVDLTTKIGLDDAELERWLGVADSMATGFDPTTRLYEQFAGYFGLEHIDLAKYAGRSVPMDVVLGRERTSRSQVVKQADVVALLALLPEAFPGDSGLANFRYYTPRCGQGSSLSRAMHGLAAARLGDTELALRFFQETAAIDLADTHVAIEGGIHIAALGGLWQMAVFGFAGLSLRSDCVAVEPRLPTTWRSLRFCVQWRGRRLRIEIGTATHALAATLIAGEPMTLLVCGERYELSSEMPLRLVTYPAPSLAAA
jgi:trehalose/maltose hydrolase-like predicted phosphorylase